MKASLKGGLFLQVLESLWLFLQNQVLGMHWLNELVGHVLTLLGVNLTGRWGASIQFFLYDTIKIFTLLSVLIFLISYIQSFFPPERTRSILGRFHGVRANTLAALLGTVTPFCSCSSIPLFIGFSGAGLPVGVTFSFLISSPLVDLGALLLLMSVFGAKIAVAYVIAGLILAVLGGTLIEKLGLSRYVEDYISHAAHFDLEGPNLTRRDRLFFAREQLVFVLKKVVWYVLVGVGIGAAIHNWIPQEWIQSLLGQDNPFSVLLATLVGVPMYADIFGAIPISEALFAKGVGVGTVLAFMMAVTALSLPSIILLRKAVKPKLLAFFVGIVTLGILIIGYSFNALQFWLV